MSDYWSTIIQAQDLKEILAHHDLVIADCRFDLGDVRRGYNAYLDAHIPGAHYVHLDDDLSVSIGNGRRGRHPLPSPQETTRLLRRMGVGESTQLVVYDDKGGAIASRLWWMARWIGHTRVAVLDGGWSAWLEADGAVEAGEQADTGGAVEADEQADTRRAVEAAEQAHTRGAVDTSVPVEGGARGTRDNWLVDAQDIERPGRSFPLVDSRTADRYRGENETIDPQAGHIPGAVNVPFPANLDSKGHFLPPDELRERFEALYDGDQGPVFYCGSGVTACHNILATQVAGLPMPRLYAASWSGWISDPDRPVNG